MPRGAASRGASYYALTRGRFLRTMVLQKWLCAPSELPGGARPAEKERIIVKAHIPKHREFLINLADDYEKKDECWAKLQEIMKEYQKQGKSVYTPTFIEDNEDKVKALQEQYEFTYTIEER